MKKTTIVNIIFILVFCLLIGTLPTFILAGDQGSPDLGPISKFINSTQAIVSQLVPLLIGLAVLVFFYGLVMFLRKGKEGGEVRTTFEQLMKYSLVALLCLMFILGIIFFLESIRSVPNSGYTLLLS